MNARRGISVTAALLAFALAACQGLTPCAEVDCAGPSIVVDLCRLAPTLRRGVAVTGCYRDACQTVDFTNDPVAGEGVQSSILIAMPPGATQPKKTRGTVELRITRAGHRVFRAVTSASLPIWQKATRCPDCKVGNAFVVVDPNGTIRSRSPF